MIPTEYHEHASKLQTSETPVDINHILETFADVQLEYIGKLTADTPLVGKNDETTFSSSSKSRRGKNDSSSLKT